MKEKFDIDGSLEKNEKEIECSFDEFSATITSFEEKSSAEVFFHVVGACVSESIAYLCLKFSNSEEMAKHFSERIQDTIFECMRIIKKNERNKDH